MMLAIDRSIQVSYRHRVFFTQEVFSPANPLLHDLLTGASQTSPQRTLVTLDQTLARVQPDLAGKVEAYFHAYPALPQLVGPPLLIPGGEQAKNSLVALERVWAAIERGGLCRHSFVIGVGGGAHLDVVGFAAATAHRGMRHIRVPSTTLAQADSGVGVKNGINAFGKKNFLGAFTPPLAVINDSRLLASLPPREKRAGFVEAVKVALIRNAAFFAALERAVPQLNAFDEATVAWLIRCCAEEHIDHITTCGDPFESGSARPLDFGHWVAHKLEALSGYRFGHGESVAIGMAVDLVYSRLAGWLAPQSAERALDLLEALGFQLFAPELVARDSSGALRVLSGLEEFREHLGGELTVTLLRELGRGVETQSLEVATVTEAIAELARRSRFAMGVQPPLQVTTNGSDTPSPP